MRIRPILTLALVLALVIALAGCAAGPNRLVGTGDDGGSTAGFWLGLWHGIIVVFSFIVSLFNDNVSVYDVHNSGHLYDLGFVMGLMMCLGGGCGGARKKRRR
jgi:hypothetical protein